MSQKDIYSKYQNQSREEEEEAEEDDDQNFSQQESPYKYDRKSYLQNTYEDEERVVGEDQDDQEEIDDQDENEEEEDEEDEEDEEEEVENQDNNQSEGEEQEEEENEFIGIQDEKLSKTGVNEDQELDNTDTNNNADSNIKEANSLINETNTTNVDSVSLNEKAKKDQNKELTKEIELKKQNQSNSSSDETKDHKIKSVKFEQPESNTMEKNIENVSEKTISTQALEIEQQPKNEETNKVETNPQKNEEETIKNEEVKQETQEVEEKPVVKEKKIEVRPKVIYDPKEDVDKYPGNYSDSSGSEEETNNDEEDDEEEDESDSDQRSKNKLQQKKKNNKKEQAKKPVVKRVLKKQTLVLNVSDTKYPVVKFVGKKIYNWRLDSQTETLDWDIFWTDNAVSPEQLGRMQPYQKINHFPGMFSLARKNHLARNLMKMSKQFPSQYKFYPQTWLLPAEYNDFRTQFEKSKSSQKIFIVKPEASCQGRGIFLTRSLDDLNPSDHYVVQRYLNKPYLIDGLKFDFRIYVLLAGCDPLRIYLYYEGLTRFATQPYKEANRDNIEDMCMHLTNYAINKDNPNFQFNEDKTRMDVGHKRSLTSVLQLLEDQGHDVNKLWKDIKRVLIKTVISAQPTLAHHYRSCQPDNFMNNMCFEVLGFDVILDNHLKPMILEVNHTPSFVTDTPLDSYIKKNIIRDALKLMNCTCRAKNEIVSQRKEIMQKRVLTGKKVKYTPEEKLEEIKKAQLKRDEYEDKHLGGFERIFPLEDDEEDKFTEYLQYALKCYEEQTGANIRRNTKKVTEDPKKITNQPKKLNQPKDLEKIYNTKIGTKLPPRKPFSYAVNKNGQRPGSSQANGEEGDNMQSEDQEFNREEGQEGGIMRSASGRMHDFRIKKQNSPYNIHQKFKNKIQGRVAIGVKELKLGEEPIQFEENTTNTTGKPPNPNQKKILAYMTSEREQLEIKNQNILQDQNYNSSRGQQQSKRQQFEPQIQMIQEVPKKYLTLNINATKPSQQKLQFQHEYNFNRIDNAAVLVEEERRQWMAQAQRNLQYQLSQQQYQPQQKITLLPKGPSMLPQQNVMTSLVDLPNPSNNKEILAAVGGAISGQYKTDKRVTYKQKGGNLVGQSLNSMKDNNGLFLQPRLFEISSFEKQGQPQLPQQMIIQNNVEQNLAGLNQNMVGLNDLFVSGKSHKVQPHYTSNQIQQAEPYNISKHSNYNYYQK